MSVKDEYRQADRRKRLMARRRDQWKAALHEAAHVVVACEMTGERLAGAQILFGGLAYVPHPADHFLNAVMAAAGREAEALAERHEAPPMSTPPAAHYPKSKARILRDDFKSDYNHGVPDAVVIAQFATQGIENQPERWQLRVRWVYRTAACSVARHEAAIVGLARLFYPRGILYPTDVESVLGRIPEPKEER